MTAGTRFWCLAFLALGLPVCVALALIVPLGEVADEAGHLARAAALAEGQLVGHRADVTYADGTVRRAAGVTLDAVWDRLGRSRPPDFRGTLGPRDAGLAEGRVFVPLYTIATYPPLLYAPAALGLLAGRGLGLEPATSARLGRLANAAAYGALGLAALALATRGRAALFALLCLPMSLSLAASFSQDGLIIALAVLAAALLTPRPLGDRRRRWAAALVIALIVLAKPPYAPLAAMLFVPLPPPVRLGRLCLRRLPLAIVAVAPAALWTVAATARVATPVPRHAYEAGPLWPGPRPAVFPGTDPGAQARVLSAAPTRLLTVPARYLLSLKHALALAAGAIGVLGWHDLFLPGPLYALWAAALLLPLVTARRGPLPPPSERWWLSACALLCLWLILLSQYLSWTDVGADRLDGPQGRYLLPLAPMLVLAFARGRIGTAATLRRPALLPVLAAAVDLVALPLVVLRV